jgi:transcriptional regulator with XRE-family HTH domain
MELTVPFLDMDFPERLARLRKAKGFTQQTLAEAIGMSLIQIHRYETGASQPPLDVLRKLAVALSVSADELVFGDAERGPDEELRLQFEAVSRFDAEEKRIAKALLDSLIIKHEAKRWMGLGAGTG